MEPVSIAVAGHICVDLTPHIGEAGDPQPGELVEVGPLAIRLGGSVANTGLVLADLGAAVVPYATIGEDGLGELLLGELTRRGLDTAHIAAVSRGTTSFSLVLERPGQDRTFWHHTGANALFDGTDVEPSDILHLGYPPLLPGLIADDGTGLRRLLSRARATGTTTSVDLSVVDPASAAGRADWATILEAMCAHTDVLSPSLDDLTSALGIHERFSLPLIDRLATRFIAAGVAVVAISAGPRGLFIRTAEEARFRAAGEALAGVSHWADQVIEVPPMVDGDPVTTNGAGDAASAGLLFALARRSTLEGAGMLAAACSAAVLSGRRSEPATIVSRCPALADLFGSRR